MNEMVEKVARAIAEQQSARMAARFPARFAYTGCSWEQFSPEGQEDARQTARAAIEAMLVPSSAMSGALRELWASDDKEKQALHYGVAWTGYRAMIDAALSEEAE